METKTRLQVAQDILDEMPVDRKSHGFEGNVAKVEVDVYRREATIHMENGKYVTASGTAFVQLYNAKS